MSRSARREHVQDLIKMTPTGKGDNLLGNLLDQLLLFAHQSRASDIHFEPIREKGIIRNRIDGFLQDEFELDLSLHHRLISLIKVHGRLRTDEHRVAQDGRLWFETPSGNVDVRISLIPVEDGERCVLRLLSSESKSFGLSSLGLVDSDLARIKQSIDQPWGMILTTGPTGCGKTTTIYSLLQLLNSRQFNIATVENPVEYYISGINQSQVDLNAGFSFADGLRAIMRQDPDIIMVGEIRDIETAKIAVNAALTGHRMFSTLHTNNASAAIPRLLDRGVEPFLVASTLICAVGQRLLRKVCSDCWSSKPFQKEKAEKIFTQSAIKTMFGKQQTIAVAQAVGCPNCNNTGYKGRVGMFEVLMVSPQIQDLIISRASSKQIQDQAIKEGMTTMYEDAVRKVLSLETSIEEFVRVMYI